jgi:hypothetical protein
MGADPADQLTVPLAHLAEALTETPRRFRLTVFAYGNISFEFLAKLQRMGVVWHDLSWRTRSGLTDQILEMDRLLRDDPVSVLISDLNFCLPTAVFARRMAPVQIFLQGGMPAWPTPGLDAVYNSFGSDPVVAGWGDAKVMPFAAPWDLASLNPPVRPEEVAAERLSLPSDTLLIGTYGRLMKVTDPFLRAVERILLACPESTFVVGGSGDSEAVRVFIANSPVGHRMQVEARYVPGHSWGRILDLFLDTWPLTGGESVRETLAKGCPVIAIHSDDMPALDLQRDQEVLAYNWDEFVEHAVRLLRDPAELVKAKQRACEFARNMSDQAPFKTFIEASLTSLYEDSYLRKLPFLLAERDLRLEKMNLKLEDLNSQISSLKLVLGEADARASMLERELDLERKQIHRCASGDQEDEGAILRGERQHIQLRDLREAKDQAWKTPINL